MKKLYFLLILSVSMMACTKGSEKFPLQTQLNDDVDLLVLLEDFPLDSFYGKTYQGGLIFYLKSNGTGMVAGTEDLSESATWGCGGETIDGADEKVIGFGKSNTDSITNQCLDIYSAAWICSNSNANGYSDWYLPSINELREMRIKLYQYGYGDFSPFYYWSSSEGEEFNSAYYQLFDDGTHTKGSKTNGFHVRAIRNF